MSIVELILKKRDGNALTKEEITSFVEDVASGNIEDYQISAMLMAIYFQGMNDLEIAWMTDAMAHTGDILSFPTIKEPIVDKHSSGGVGDKTSLVLAPMVAACGLPIAKLSGRGLGFTGGTVDKLESIPGFHTELTEEEFIRFVEKDGIALMGQSANIAPADKKLYALRDVTGTVDSIPLIAASIMSKKLADGSDAIVLDVKCGSGAFMKTQERAIELAKTMVAIGENNGKNVIALVTDMNQPLGQAVGNSVEMIEAIEALNGRGPKDFVDECYALAKAMLIAGGKAKDDMTAQKMLTEVIQNGKALEKFKDMVRNQGGDVSYIENTELFEKAKIVLEAKCDSDGIVQTIDTEEVGNASLLLGAGRVKASDPIDYSVGLYIDKKVGDVVSKGDVLFRVLANDEIKAKQALERVQNAYTIGKQSVEKFHSPIIARVDKNGVEVYR